MKLSTDKLREIRDSFPAFCRLVMHRDVDPRQMAPFVGSEKFSVFVAGRGCGKTTVALQFMLWRLFREERHVGIWVASAEEVSGHGADVLADFLLGTPLESYITERSADRIRFSNRSVLYFLPNSQRRVRGFHGRWTQDYGISQEGNLLRRLAKARKRAPSITPVIVDESKDVSPEVYTGLLGVLSTSPAPKAIFMGTAGGRDHWFAREYAAGVEADGDTRSYLLRAEDCDWISEEFLEEMRRKMTPEEFGAEFCGVFMDALSSYFSAPMVSAATREYSVPADDYDDRFEYVVSIDLAPSERFGSDFAVVMVLGRTFGHIEAERWQTLTSVHGGTKRRRPAGRMTEIPPHIRICYLSRHQHLDHEGLRRELAEVKRQFPGCARGICESYESQQLDAIVRRVVRKGQDGEKYTHYGRGEIDLTFEIVNPTSPAKHEGFSGLHQLLREGELWLPDSGDNVRVLRSELLHLQREITPAGNVRFAAASGHHDDTTMALMWGCVALRRQRSFSDLVQLKDEYVTV